MRFMSDECLVKLYLYPYIKNRKEIECYDNVMELRPNYPKILYNLGLGYKQRLKNIFIKEVINKIRRRRKIK